MFKNSKVMIAASISVFLLNQPAFSSDRTAPPPAASASAASASAASGTFDRDSALKLFSNMKRHTLPTLFRKAQSGDQDAMKELLEITDACLFLEKCGDYQPRGTGKDKAIFEATKYVKLHAAEIDAFRPAALEDAEGDSSGALPVTLGKKYDCATKDQRRAIWEENRVVSKNGYTFGLTVLMPETEKIDPSIVEWDSIRHFSLPAKKFTTQVRVVNEDSINVGLAMGKKTGKRPLILDMANATMPGGDMGAGNAQEEVMAYRGDLQFALAALYDKEVKMRRLNQGNFLPLEGGAFLKGVSIWRDWDTIGSTQAYAYRDQIEQVDIFAAAALRHGSRLSLTPKKGADEEKWPFLKGEEAYWETTANKIRAMLHFAALKKDDKDDKGDYGSVVLGAFGNGAFANPVPETIGMFKKVLREFDGQFEEVCFAVLTPSGNTRLFDKYYQELDGFDTRP